MRHLIGVVVQLHADPSVSKLPHTPPSYLVPPVWLREKETWVRIQDVGGSRYNEWFDW